MREIEKIQYFPQNLSFSNLPTEVMVLYERYDNAKLHTIAYELAVMNIMFEVMPNLMED